MDCMMFDCDRKPGDVFQINETHGREGWIGVFILATEIRTWGIQGFTTCIKTHNEKNLAYIRLEWSEIDYIGRAALIPDDLEKTT